MFNVTQNINLTLSFAAVVHEVPLSAVFLLLGTALIPVTPSDVLVRPCCTWYRLLSCFTYNNKFSIILLRYNEYIKMKQRPKTYLYKIVSLKRVTIRSLIIKTVEILECLYMVFL